MEKKVKLTNFYCGFFFRVFIFSKYELCAYLACIHFRDGRLKENFACI